MGTLRTMERKRGRTDMLTPSILMGGEFSAFGDLMQARFHNKRTYKAGEVILEAHEGGTKTCYYLLSGLVITQMLHESGKYAELNVRGPGTIFPLYYTPETSAMGQVLEVSAQKDCTVLVIPRAEVRALMLEVPAFAIAMVDAYAKFASYLEFVIVGRLHDTLQTRVCDFLYLHMDKRGVVDSTQEQIANAVGASRSKVTEALSQLYDAGIIETRRGSVIVSNTAALHERCSYVAQTKDD